MNAALIGYLGPEGTFSHVAAEMYRKQNDAAAAVLQAYAEIDQLIRAVAGKEIDRAVVPVENSLEGTVNLTLDELAVQPEVWIQGELVVAVRHSLLVGPKVELDEITHVCSHPQALAQCRHYLARVLPQAQVVTAASTADAARTVKTRIGWAAIAGRSAAERYQLLELAAGVQDQDNNATRFLIIGRRDCRPTGGDRTSILFAAPHQPGALYAVLGEFAAAGINLTRIESRPARSRLGEYIFHVDFEGHRRDPIAARTLQAVGRQASCLRVLGSYPRADLQPAASS